MDVSDVHMQTATGAPERWALLSVGPNQSTVYQKVGPSVFNGAWDLKVQGFASFYFVMLLEGRGYESRLVAKIPSD